jgi:hypothetical protein
MTELTTATAIGSDLDPSNILALRRAGAPGLRRATISDIISLVPGGGGGGSGLIQAVQFTGGETEHTIAVPNTFQDLEISFQGNISAVATIALYFNGDFTDAHYYSQRDNITGQASGFFSYLADGTNSNLNSESAILRLPGYNQASTFQKTMPIVGCYRDAGNCFSYKAILLWQDTSPITSVTIAAKAGAFIAGSEFAVFGK